jgi:hypothetical protein
MCGALRSIHLLTLSGCKKQARPKFMLATSAAAAVHWTLHQCACAAPSSTLTTFQAIKPAKHMSQQFNELHHDFQLVLLAKQLNCQLHRAVVAEYNARRNTVRHSILQELPH